MSLSGGSETATEDLEGGAARGGGPSLQVIGDGLFQRHPLPVTGEITIGRAGSADIVIDDASISRRHALLRIGPGTFRIRDLGSANGTRVGDRALAADEEVSVAPGQVVDLGRVLVFVQAPRGDAMAAPAAPRSHIPAAVDTAGMIFQNRAMQDLVRLVERVANGPITVLLLGETGVGKEVMASLIHSRSPRAAGPFMAINCASLSESLLESELFGHEKGAFTGAVTTRPGLLESASGGTVFLDEIGEVGAAFQAKLLRVLEDRQVLRVGGRTPRSIDVRFVAATNRNLEDLMARDAFRADLYYRLSGVCLMIPPVRERLDELPALAGSLIARFCTAAQRPVCPRPDAGALARLAAHPWPGNLRELRNVIERAVLVCDGDTIRAEHIAFGGRGGAVQIAPAETPSSGSEVGDLMQQVRAAERRRVIEALDQCGGNQTRAARLLSISRTTLVARIEEFGLVRPRKR
jgi:transcriptional regulator with PAS, ATPase and Fis domain